MKRLLIFARIAALPAAALSLKDWEAKPADEQIKYLTASLARLVVAVNKTDQPLADKIKHYYTDKPNGLKSPPACSTSCSGSAASKIRRRPDRSESA